MGLLLPIFILRQLPCQYFQPVFYNFPRTRACKYQWLDELFLSACCGNKINPSLPFARALPVFAPAFLRPAPAVNIPCQLTRFIHIKYAFLAQTLFQSLHLPDKALLCFGSPSLQVRLFFYA